MKLLPLCCCWLVTVVVLVTGDHHPHRRHISPTARPSHRRHGHGDLPHGGGSVMGNNGTQPKDFGFEVISHRSRPSPVKAIAFNSDRYDEWSEWSECIRADCIEERHRECLDDSWKEIIPNRLLTTRCISRYYVEKRLCTNLSLCGSTGLPDQCGVRPVWKKRTAKIIGGRTATPHSWPWAVRLSIKYPGQPPALLCGGTLIAPNWIVTAAHCLVRSAVDIPVGKLVSVSDHLTGMIYAHVGDHLSNVKENNQRDIRVTKASIHPSYHKSLMTDGYDLALLYLSESVDTYPNEIGPVCLPDKNISLPPGTKCYAVGWGDVKPYRGPTFDNYERFFESMFPMFPSLLNRPSLFSIDFRRRKPQRRNQREKPSELREVEIPILDTRVCEKDYDQLNEKLHICAGSRGKDTCEGDSGGGLFCQAPETNQWYVAGITSFGIHRGCGRYPGIYTSVKAHLDWIMKTVAMAPY